MNTGGLVCGLIFTVLMIVFLAKHMDAKPEEMKFNDDEEDV
jgi:hypothetical protein